MATSGDIRSVLHERLRRDASPLSVPGSLPVLFFGDLFDAPFATVSLNPSPQEYLDRQGLELQGAERRFDTLASLGSRSRAELTDAQCDRAIDTMRNYYQPGKPMYRWFHSFVRFANGLGLDYGKSQIAHLDLIQEATLLTWSQHEKASPAEFGRLFHMDLAFLKWQLEAFPLAVVFCNGRTPFDALCQLTAARVVRTDELARVEWFVAVGTAGSRRVIVAGWNLPLARPTGLGAHGETDLGKRIWAAVNGIVPGTLPSGT